MTAEPHASTALGLLQIGERTGLSLRTVRRDQQVGLLPPAERSPGGLRLYDGAAVQRLLVSTEMEPLELTLEELRELLDHVDELGADREGARRREIEDVLAGCSARVAQRTGQLRERLAGVKALKNSLDDLLL